MGLFGFGKKKEKTKAPACSCNGTCETYETETVNGAVLVEQGLGYSIIIEGAMPYLDERKITYRPLSPA